MMTLTLSRIRLLGSINNVMRQVGVNFYDLVIYLAPTLGPTTVLK